MCDITEITGNTGVCCAGSICGTSNEDLRRELNDAVDELVTAVEGLAHDYVSVVPTVDADFVVDIHDTSDDTATITDAADHLNHRLEG